MTALAPPLFVTPQPGETLGRFVLRRVLGRGAQATVWLAEDPHLQREVALKIMDPGMAQDQVSHWLQEARLMSTLAHPGILTVHEAASDGARHYLVLEYIEGQSLSERLKRKGALPAREAVELMRSVADALACAHARGVIHRDLKPSNILVGTGGVCKVMDFGIAARVSGEHDGRIVGTPGYISPEAAAGGAPTPAMDVYAAGMVLGHLLLGQPLLRDKDPLRALRRAIDEDVRWPDTDAARAIDDNLRAIVMQAVARDPAARLPSTEALRDALTRWLTPPAAEVGDFGATLEYLLRRMRMTGDFPALSDQVMRIQRVTSADDAGLPELTSEIQKDVGLTHKLLRMVNSAQFRARDEGEVNSVARAASLVGFSAIRNMALSVKLLEHMSDAAHAEHMRGLFMRALLTASIADELTPANAQREDAFLLGMLSQLGRLLVAYYFAAEARQIAQRLPEGASPEAEDAVVRDVLGASYEDLGLGVAKAWGLSDRLRTMMRRPTGDAPGQMVADPTDRMRWRLRLAGEMAELVLTEPAASLEPKADALAKRYAAAVEAPPGFIRQAVKSAQSHIKELASHFRFKRKRDDEPSTGTRLSSGVTTLASRTTAVSAAHTRKVLQTCIAEITATVAQDEFKLNDVLHQVMTALEQALALQRVIFALRDPRSGLLMGRLGVGLDAQDWCRRLVVDLRATPPADLLAAVCLKGVDTLIADARAPNLTTRLPGWLRPMTPRSLLLLPLATKGATFGLLYADREREPALALAERELELVRTLRNQVVLAFKARR
ncbi:MAG: HDOD domain-containing protein [Proteobacteria bacterium]|nr:HDOD domain-containing protein [Pseudomonadota bacterium]